MRTGTNLPAIGGYNQAVVLDAVRRAPDGLSRVELSARTGLSAQTISNVTRRLLDARLVRETGKVVNGPGKPRTILQLEARGSFAVGVHIDPAVITYVVLDLQGRVVAHSRTRTSPADQVIALMARSIESLIASSGVDRSLVLGVGIASPGPIDISEGIVLDPPMLSSWKDVPLRSALSAATGLPVLLEKDVTAAAVAELWFAREGTRANFAFVYYGTGFGTGLVINREVVRGSSSNAGDAGHIPVDPVGTVTSAGMVEPRGTLCGCGRAGCVGTLITPRALVDQAVAEGILAAPDGRDNDPVDMTSISVAFHELATIAGSGDVPATRLLQQAARRLARAIVVIANLLDLDEFVFGGPFWDAIGDVLLDVIPTAVESSAALTLKHGLRFERSRIGEDIAAVGAACLVLDNVFSPRPSAMLISV